MSEPVASIYSECSIYIHGFVCFGAVSAVCLPPSVSDLRPYSHSLDISDPRPERTKNTVIATVIATVVVIVVIVVIVVVVVVVRRRPSPYGPSVAVLPANRHPSSSSASACRRVRRIRRIRRLRRIRRIRRRPSSSVVVRRRPSSPSSFSPSPSPLAQTRATGFPVFAIGSVSAESAQ